MKLQELFKGEIQILAIKDARDKCQIQDVLIDIDSRVSTKMITLLDRVSKSGVLPNNQQKVKHLRNGIWEFKADPKRGAKLRVLFFKDGPNIVVCTEAFAKRDKTPQEAISRCEQLKARYIADKNSNQITIDKLDE